MNKSQIKALIRKNIKIDNLEKSKEMLKNQYNISFGRYEPEEIRQSLIKGLPVLVQDHFIIGMDEAKQNTFEDTDGKVFSIDVPVKAIIVNDEIDQDDIDASTDNFAIIGRNEWKTPINEFDNIIAPLRNGKPFLPKTPVIFNFLNLTDEIKKTDIVSKTVGAQIYLYDKDGYIDNAFHEIGHIFWRTRLTYDEQELFQEIFDSGKLSSAIYEYEWEKKSAEEIFCTVYKWYLKSILINTSFRKILSFEEPDGYDLMVSIVQRIGEDNIRSDVWESVEDKVREYLNPRYDTTTNSFIRKRGDFDAIKDVEIPSELLEDISSVQDGIKYVNLFKGKNPVPVKEYSIDFVRATEDFTKKLEKSRPIIPAGKEVLYMDMDGVIADIGTGYKELSGRNIFKDDTFTVRQTIGLIPHFWRKLPVLPKGKELYDMLKDYYAIIFLTTPMDSIDSCKMDKIAWAKQYFPEVKTILFSDKKEEYAASNKSVLIDDYGKNVKAFNDAGGSAINFKEKNTEIVSQIKEIFNPKDEIAEIKEQLKSMQVDPSPFEAQKKTGNYKKGKILFKGLSLIIENPKGSIRFGRGSDGKRWMNIMKAHYGYIDTKPGEEGADGDKIDFFLGENLSTNKVFAINQVCPETGMFDEIKLVMGCNTAEEAEKLYRSCYSKNWTGFGSIVQTNTKGIREYIQNGYRYEPFGDNFIEQEPLQKATFLEMLKARITKYVRREPDGKGGWKYFYKNNIKNNTIQNQEEHKDRKISQTETPEFKKWFGDSKVVDKNGKPLIVYHGTTASNIKEFKPERLHGRNGIYFTDKQEEAQLYGSNIIKVYVKMENPKIFDAEGKSFNDIFDKIEPLLRFLGKFENDGIIIKNVYDSPSGKKEGRKSTTFIVDDASQIKSATNNNGNFDPNESDMTKAHDSFDISDKEIVQSLDQIKKEITVNHDFDIPYLCGYSKDAKTIYIDRHLPKMKTRGHFDSDDALIMHEATEKAMEKTYHLEYAKAHQIALRAEKAYVESQGISWKGYNSFMQKYIKKAGDERLTETPKNLDLQPYRNCHDYSELTKISKVQK